MPIGADKQHALGHRIQDALDALHLFLDLPQQALTLLVGAPAVGDVADHA